MARHESFEGRERPAQVSGGSFAGNTEKGVAPPVTQVVPSDRVAKEPQLTPPIVSSRSIDRVGQTQPVLQITPLDSPVTGEGENPSPTTSASENFVSGHARHPLELDERALAHLTPRESAIVRQDAQGMNSFQIAEGMGRSGGGFRNTIDRAKGKYRQAKAALDTTVESPPTPNEKGTPLT